MTAPSDTENDTTEPITAPLEVGTALGGTTLTREIGSGAQGVVYLGHQASLDRDVAVKILPKHATFSQEQIDRFHLEAEAAGRLNHPNIVAVYGIEETGGHHVILQEYVSGGSLAGVLEKEASEGSRTSLDRCRWAAQLCAQLARALAHAHAHSVVHRDMKPGNVLLTTDGQPKITDFGLARIEDKLGMSRTGAVMGTPHYMSPEQVRAKPEEIDARTDVYSLGALLYHLLCGRVPFTADNIQAIFLDILTRAPRSLRKQQPAVSADLEAVCLHALEKSPGDRYETADAFADDLERYLRGEPTQARPVTVFGRAARAMKRQSTSALVAIALLVVTAWVALDVWQLQLASADVGVHDVRLGLIGVGALLLCWPLSVLSERLSKGRAWSAAPALLLAGGLATFGGWRVHEQKLDQQHHAAREALMTRVEFEEIGDERDIADLEEYAASWSARLDDEDAVVLARAYLTRERPADALLWAERITSAAVGPVREALFASIFGALGDDERATEARRRLDAARAADVPWQQWIEIGDILSDAADYEGARDVYERAGRLPGADRDRLNLSLADVYQGLCLWDVVPEYLEDFMKWYPRDARANHIAYLVARKTHQWDLAEQHLTVYEASPGAQTLRALEMRRALLFDQGRLDEAEIHLTRVIETESDDAAVLAYCASELLDQGRTPEAWANAYAAEGDEVEAERFRASAREIYGEARELYERIARIDPDSPLAPLGEAALAIEFADVDPDKAAAHLADAVAAAERSVELAPDYWQAHFNLGLAHRRAQLLEHGGSTATLPLDALGAYVDDYRRAIELNGLQANVLNDTADTLGRMYELTGDRALLDEAFEYARRAIRLKTPSAASACERDDPMSRVWLSALNDTLSTLHELAGDLDAALARAEDALAILDEGNPRVPKRRARVQRLRAEVDAAR